MNMTQKLGESLEFSLSKDNEKRFDITHTS